MWEVGSWVAPGQKINGSTMLFLSSARKLGQGGLKAVLLRNKCLEVPPMHLLTLYNVEGLENCEYACVALKYAPRMQIFLKTFVQDCSYNPGQKLLRQKTVGKN